MKKLNSVAWFITVCMLLIAGIGLFYLPDRIAVQWNENGVSSTVEKWIVLALPLLAAVLTILHGSHPDEGRKVIDLYYTGVLVVFAAELLIIGNALQFIDLATINIEWAIKITGILAGCLLMYFGNRLPKIARNYYYGIKTPWALRDDDSWTKTQRMAGKVWLTAGLLLAALSFAPLSIQSAAFPLAALVLLLAPRLYGKRLAESKRGGDGVSE